MPHPNRLPPLSDAQLEIMNVVWQLGEVSAGDVWNVLSERRSIARNTVQTVMTRLNEKGWLKHRKQVRSWFDEDPFYPSSSIPMLYINHTRPYLDDVRLRRAMAFAINYKDIRELAVSGYSPPLKPGLILPFGTEAKYYSEEDAARYGVSFDPEKAKQILKQAGYKSTFDADGKLQEMHDADGKRVPTIEITSPAGWTDWESLVRIVVWWARASRALGAGIRGAADWTARTVRPPGALVALAATAGLILGVAFGWVEWMIAGAASLVLLAACIPFLFGARAYEVELTLSRDRITAGQHITGRIDVRNVHRRSALPGRLDIPVGEGLVEFAVPLLRPASRTKAFGSAWPSRTPLPAATTMTATSGCTKGCMSLPGLGGPR